jgi:glycosyltransferase involved in cell wall biosynthesis
VKGPLVSLVVPVYNSERFLGEALESLFRLDYERFEVIVVDDGSSDGSVGVARSFPVRLIEQENKGPAAARNAGLAVADGEFLGIHDSDDVVPADKLNAQVTHLLENSRVGCVLGRQRWIDPPGTLTRDPIYGELDGIPLPSAVFRTSILRELGGYDESYRSHENMDLLFRMRERGYEVAVLPDIVLFRRYHGDNLSFASWPEKDPRLRSLKAKLDRSRKINEAGAEGGTCGPPS